MSQALESGWVGCYMLVSQPYSWYLNAQRNRRLAKDRKTVPERSQEARTKKTPECLFRVRARARALTLPLPDACTDGKSQWTSNQAKSFFFGKVPFELREQIYRELLCQKDEEDVLHIESSVEKLYHVRCTEKNINADNRVGWQHKCWHWHRKEKLLAFLQTCRRACVSCFQFPPSRAPLHQKLTPSLYPIAIRKLLIFYIQTTPSPSAKTPLSSTSPPSSPRTGSA